MKPPRRLQSPAAHFLTIAALALVVRSIYLWQVADLPLFTTLLGDSRVYWEWAGKMAQGDWLGRDIGTFYQAPLYPYFLAMIRTLGGDTWVVRLAQIVLSALSCGLITLTGRRLFSPAAGLAAGGFMAVYAPSIFFDGLLQKASFGFFWMALLLYLIAELLHRERQRLWVACGAVLGCLCLVRENALLLIPVLALWLLLAAREEPSAAVETSGGETSGWASLHLQWRWKYLAAFSAGLLLILSPVALRNLALGGDLALTTSQAGPNFYIGNNPAATGTYAPLRAGRSDTHFERRDAVILAEQAMGDSLTAKQVSNYWFGRAFQFIREEPGRWLGLVGRKTVLTLHKHELTDTDDFYLYQEKSSWLKGLAAIFHFGFLLPLGATGIILSWRRLGASAVFQRLLPYYLILLTSGAAVILFFVFARYRFVLVPPLALFAGFAVIEIIERGRGRDFSGMGIPLVAAALAALLANAPIDPPGAGSALPLSNLGAALAGQEHYEEAVEAYREALRRDPNLMEAHLNLGSTLVFLGQPEEAIEHLETARRLAPEDAEAEYLLGRTLLAQGRRSAGLEHLQRAYDLAIAAGDKALAQQIARLMGPREPHSP